MIDHLTHPKRKYDARIIAACLAIVSFLGLSGVGCSLFGGGGGDTPRDPCEDAFNRYVTQHPNGVGVTAQDCAASERGQWIEGRCYCHGEAS